MVRLKHWEESFVLYIDRCRDLPFVWGEHDCALFASGALKVMTGVELLGKGKYEDAHSAALYLREQGFGTLKNAAQKLLGKPQHPARAKRGDIVLRNKALGVCYGRGAWFVGQFGIYKGLLAVPLRETSLSWVVPFHE